MGILMRHSKILVLLCAVFVYFSFAYAQQAVVVVNPLNIKSVPTTTTIVSSGTVTAKAVIYNSLGSEVTTTQRQMTPTGPVLQVQIGPGDVISNIPVTTSFEHHQLHEGESYRTGYYLSTGVSTTQFLISVPVFTNTIQGPHLIMHVQAYEGAGELRLYENPTAYTGGTLMTTYNANRNSANTSRTTIYSGITASTGTQLPASIFFSASVRGAGESRAMEEWILKSNTNYRVDLEEITAISRIAIHFEWYEDAGI